MRFEYKPGLFKEQLITNLAHMCVDSDHARDLKTRKSVTCIIVAIYGIIVHWVMQKQTCIAAHSTDAEIRAYFSAVQLNKYVRCVLQFLCHDMRLPTTIYEDNQPALDIMTAGHITTQVKHMAIPIAIIHKDCNDGNSRGEKISTVLNVSDI